MSSEQLNRIYRPVLNRLSARANCSPLTLQVAESHRGFSIVELLAECGTVSVATGTGACESEAADMAVGRAIRQVVSTRGWKAS